MKKREVVMKRIAPVLAIVVCLGLAWAPPASAQTPQTVMDPESIPKFVNQLPLLGPTGLPVVDGTVPSMLSICEFQAQVLPPGMPKTWVWGYQIGDTCDPDPGHSYIGPVVVAQRGTPTNLTFINQLGYTWDSKVLAFTQNTDVTMHWADPLNSEQSLCSHRLSQGYLAPSGECANNYSGPIAAAVHLHGGEIPPNLDGGPDSWFTGDGQFRGHGYYTREATKKPKLPNPDFPAGSLILNTTNGRYYKSLGDKWDKQVPNIDRATYVYPNTQEAANIWFHDHVLGMTRLNVYAGIAGAYVIQDPDETNPALGPVTNLVPIVIQDRFFDTNGQLYFSDGGTTPEHPFWVPEFIGDVAVVNGAAWPSMTVEPKKYRFLFLNGSNSIGYDLFMVEPNVAGPQSGPDMWVIGTDGGYLDTPEKAFDQAAGAKLVLLPGERYEVIMDFSAFAGKTLEMRNSAWNPYPFGDAAPIEQIMQFKVSSTATSTPDDVTFDPETMSPRNTPIVPLGGLTPGLKRQLTLNEVESKLSHTPLEALLNNTKWDGMQIIEDGPPNSIVARGDFLQSGDYSVPTFYSELPVEGSFETWEIINITADAHPIHLHLVQFQILERRPFDEECYNYIYNASFPATNYQPGYGPPNDYNIPNDDGAVGGNPAPSLCPIDMSARGGLRGPEAHEQGWKDTAVMYPGEVTKIAVRFAPTDIAATEIEPANLIYPFNPDDGHGYVWHCHILDHEDNEMMRPTEVLVDPAFNGARGFVRGIDY